VDGDKALRARKWKDASRIFRRILGKDPESILAFAEQAETLRAQGRVEEAEELVAAGLTIDWGVPAPSRPEGTLSVDTQRLEGGAGDLGEGLKAAA
jgi:uncharacterized protein HemY